MSPTIRIDDDVYEWLKSHAEPFVDTPNSVLRRLLGLATGDGAAAEDDFVTVLPASAVPASLRKFIPTVPAPKARPTKKGSAKKARPVKRTRVPNGSLLPEDHYDVPLLTTLMDHGGAAQFQEVVVGVGEKLGDRLTELDREKLNSGAIRWHSRLQFVRLRLVQQGLLAKDSPRGVWAITEEGRDFVSNNVSGAA